MRAIVDELTKVRNKRNRRKIQNSKCVVASVELMKTSLFNLYSKTIL